MTVLVADTAGNQVFNLVPEWDYVDGGHLSAPPDDIAAGWFAVAYAARRSGPRGLYARAMCGPRRLPI
jgi:hypothetical protein